jgi:predicted GIY-YIG superfamily endonuclease
MKITTPVFLYRLYDNSDRLLYIGITESVGQRMSVHAAKKTWWPDVATVKVEMLDGDRPHAEESERLAILAEKPLHNRAKTKPRKPRTAVQAPPRITPRKTPRPARISTTARGGVLVDNGKGLHVSLNRWPQTDRELLLAQGAVPAGMWDAFLAARP